MKKIFLSLWLIISFPLTVQAVDLPDFTPLVQKNSPAVVNISTKTTRENRSNFQFRGAPGMDDEMLEEFMRRFFGENPPGGGSHETESLGSGFVISQDGYIVTNHHVVKGADEIQVRFNDRTTKTAKLIGSDERSDVALLKVDANNLPVLSLGKSDELDVGEWVVAIGSPFGFDHSVTAGIVSAKGRSLPDENYVPFIQTDVAINPGNSGGPLFNLDGEVVGINSQIYSRSGGFMGLSFSIPIDVAMNVVDQLKANGSVERGWLGVYIQEVDRDLAESLGLSKPQGALVAQLIKDSPAEKGGIRVRDVILEFNGSPINRSGELPPLVGLTQAGQKVPVVVQREGKRKTLRIHIGTLPEEKVALEKTSQTKPKADVSVLGMKIEELSGEQRDALEIKTGGVLVQQILDDPAGSAGIRPGDVITMLDGKEITSVEQFKDMAGRIAPGKSVSVLVQRRNGSVFLALRVPRS